MPDLETEMLTAAARILRLRRNFLLTLYFLVALITFAHRVSEPMIFCLNGQQVGAPDDFAFRRAMTSLLIAPFWPLYWSWAAAEKMRGAPAETPPPVASNNLCAWQKPTPTKEA